ncbi:MAG: MBL fold metallo-hydrolase [Clostridiales bacterium]|nr:MBL fold metallo-hydrolase [Clostridiales bacterium]
MTVQFLTVGRLAENTYILSGEDGAVIIDPGAEYERIVRTLNGKSCTHVLLTHAHIDHIGAAAKLQQSGAKVYLHEADMPLLNGRGNLSDALGIPLEPFTPDVLLKGGETLDLPCGQVCVLHTAGHTAGSVCYVVGDALFSGDTLFYLAAGRTDFPSGSITALFDSIRNKLFALKGNYTVYSGHGEPTTLAFERENNPYA